MNDGGWMMLDKKNLIYLLCMALLVSGIWGCGGSGLSVTSEKTLAAYIERGYTAEGKPGRVLVVDTRSSAEYIDGHIKDAMNVPYDMVAGNGMPLYHNGWDTISATASDQLADSWFAHMLINQLVNDFVSTYSDSRIIFYGKASRNAVVVAEAIGYQDISYLSVDYDRWAEMYPDLTRQFGQGVVSVDKAGKSFVFKGSINAANYDNVSTRATHHGITYYGGALSFNSFLLANIPPFIFHEILVYLGATPRGNMAKGIYYGDMDEWGVKFPNGQRIDFSVKWEGADRFYGLSELFEEKPSEFDPNPEAFVPVGMVPRMGGTRDSNLLWNPGCIYCQYACVCGITSNAKANEITWFDDGGIYDVMIFPDDERNYYAGRFYPRLDLFPGKGEAIQIKAAIVD